MREDIQLSPTDATLDAFPSQDTPRMADGSSGSHSSPQRQKVALIEGTGPELTGETTGLLRTRLRASALALIFGFTGFFIYQLFFPNDSIESPLLTYARLAVVAVLAACAARLCRRCQIPLNHLRIYELVIFGLPVVYMGMMQTAIMHEMNESKQLPPMPSTWLSLIYIYALFIPNTWKRAAVVLGVMAATPILITTYLAFEPSKCGHMICHSPTYLAGMVLRLSLAYGTSVFGTHMINNLRREVFEAKQLGQYKLCRLLAPAGWAKSTWPSIK